MSFLTAMNTPPPWVSVSLSRLCIVKSQLKRPGSPISPSACLRDSQLSVTTTMSGFVLSIKFWNRPLLLDTDLQFIFSKRSDVFLLVWFLRLGGNGDDMVSGAPGDEDTDPKFGFTVSLSIMVDMEREGVVLRIPQAAQCQLASELPRSSYVTVQICWQPAWNHCWHVSHITPLSTQSTGASQLPHGNSELSEGPGFSYVSCINRIVAM